MPALLWHDEAVAADRTELSEVLGSVTNTHQNLVLQHQLGDERGFFVRDGDERYRGPRSGERNIKEPSFFRVFKVIPAGHGQEQHRVINYPAWKPLCFRCHSGQDDVVGFEPLGRMHRDEFQVEWTMPVRELGLVFQIPPQHQHLRLSDCTRDRLGQLVQTHGHRRLNECIILDAEDVNGICEV